MADDPTRPFTATELRGLSKLHTTAANMAERMGPNVGYARTFRACAIALAVAADWMEKEEIGSVALDGEYENTTYKGWVVLK